MDSSAEKISKIFSVFNSLELESQKILFSEPLIPDTSFVSI